MAPEIHPPCTPTASCTPIRCHPTPPPCSRPAKCLRTTSRKNIKPCQSAASIMSTRSKSSCKTCSLSKCNGCRKDYKKKSVDKFLKEKSREAKMKREDRLKGTRKFEKYSKTKGRRRSQTDCCQGKGHRGRVKAPVKCCEIL